MIIVKSTIGTGKRQRDVYDVCNSIADTGAPRPESIARFDSLEAATIVMRYMRGDSLSEADTVQAREAIKKADKKADTAPTKAQVTA